MRDLLILGWQLLVLASVLSIWVLSIALWGAFAEAWLTWKFKHLKAIE